MYGSVSLASASIRSSRDLAPRGRRVTIRGVVVDSRSGIMARGGLERDLERRGVDWRGARCTGRVKSIRSEPGPGAITMARVTTMCRAILLGAVVGVSVALP